MKVRSGFVSNSSSSSFFILVKEDDSIRCVLNAIKCVLEKYSDKSASSGRLKYLIEDEENNMKELTKEFENLKKSLVFMKKASSNEDAILIFRELYEFSLFGDNYVRYRENETADDFIKRHIETIGNEIKHKKYKIDDSKKRLKTYRDLLKKWSDNASIYYITASYSDEMYRCIEDMNNHGFIEIIYE